MARTPVASLLMFGMTMMKGIVIPLFVLVLSDPSLLECELAQDRCLQTRLRILIGHDNYPKLYCHIEPSSLQSTCMGLRHGC